MMLRECWREYQMDCPAFPIPDSRKPLAVQTVGKAWVEPLAYRNFIKEITAIFEGSDGGHRLTMALSFLLGVINV